MNEVPKPVKPALQTYAVAAYELLLQKHEGHISPGILLEAAKDPASPFHTLFEWDDTKAGDNFRLMQAASIIRRWKGSVMRIDQGEQKVVIQTIRRVQSPKGSRKNGQASYETVEQIMSDPAKRSDMVRTVRKELLSYRQRYAELTELAAVWREIDRVMEEAAASNETPVAAAG